MTDKTWGLTETGSVFHSFKANDTGICRSNLKAGVMFQREGGRTEDAVDRVVAGSPHLFRKCGSCAKREAAFRERAETSMQPVGEYDQACEGITGYGDAAPVTGLAEHKTGQDIEPVVQSRQAAVYGAAPSSECETVVDADAMRQADDALAFAMDAGAPADEVEDDECVDADGNVYPEHTEDDECRRCGAEMPEQHERNEWFWSADSGHCPHGGQPDEDDEDEYDEWMDRHQMSDWGYVCLDAPMGDACEDCSAEAGEFVAWVECELNTDAVDDEPDVDVAGRTVEQMAVERAAGALVALLGQVTDAVAEAVSGTSARVVTQKPSFQGDLLRPTDEVDEYQCVDGQGNDYPEHEEDSIGGECVRCGAETVDRARQRVDGAGRTYAEYHPGSRSEACRCPHPADEHSIYGCADDCACEWMPKRAARQTSARVVTQKPAVEADPFASGPTPEEARANVVRRFPRGTRVTWTEEDGAARHGTVNGYDIGTVTAAGHYNDGRIYIGVDEDDASAASGRFRRQVFADMLDK